MTTHGLSPQGLDRLRRVMTSHVERGHVPGLVVAIHRHGETWLEAIGRRAFDGDPMTTDTIFRISSMTKPIVAVAAMTLVEECRLRLDHPVDVWLPELADRRVLRAIDGSLDDTVPAEGPITLRHLLTSTMGFGQTFRSPVDTPVIAEAERLGVAPGPPLPRADLDPDQWLARLGDLPLLAQPGSRFFYDTPMQVLGVLLARSTGQPLEDLLRDRILGPLGMTDTGFTATTAQAARLATQYRQGDDGLLAVVDGGADTVLTTPPAFPDGAGGLISTAADCLAFGRMMLGGGRLSETRVLARPTLAAMTTDQLTPAQKAGDIIVGDPDARGWGFGLGVITRRDAGPSSPGRFGWDGGFGTSWYADPAEDMTAVLLTQRAFGWPDIGLRDDFWTAVYAAIDD